MKTDESLSTAGCSPLTQRLPKAQAFKEAPKFLKGSFVQHTPDQAAQTRPEQKWSADFESALWLPFVTFEVTSGCAARATCC